MDGYVEKTFVVIDSKTGSPSNCYVKKISPKAKVEEIADLLGLNDAILFYSNRCTSLNYQDLIEEAFDSEDVVYVWIGAPPAPEEEIRRKLPKNIRNNSDNKDIVVVAETQDGLPIFFEGRKLKAVNFKSWTWPWNRKIEIYCKDGEDPFGEPIYMGRTYHFDEDENILFYSYENDGLYMQLKDQDCSKPVHPVGKELKRWESDFRKPIGGKLKLTFENTGSKPLILVFGKKADFDGTPTLEPGVQMNIEIRENTRGFEFGLSEATEGGGAGQNEYKATMFHAQEVANGKLIKVWRESGEDKATIVLTDGTEHPLTNTRTVHYREEDRIDRKSVV